jgi:hypothetical protein
LKEKSLTDSIYASFIASSFKKNTIFDLSHPWNRDNCLYPFYLLRENLLQHGIEVNTADVNGGRKLAFELHMDVQRPCFSKACYLLMLETPQVWPANGVMTNFDCYRKIFTWNDELVDGQRFIKINFPNTFYIHSLDGFENRDRFCCLIAGNKTLSVSGDQNLYQERVRAIRWFEANALHDFYLYGVGWDMPVVLTAGFVGRIERRFWQFINSIVNLQPFPSYRGMIKNKRDVLTRTRFAICYENVRDLPGYITEKIFDCFFSGCVPVYCGASNVKDHIPAGCFVDRRQFRDTGEVYRFLKAMTEQEFKGYQQRIATFLESDAAYPFSTKAFAETIVSTIAHDFGR